MLSDLNAFIKKKKEYQPKTSKANESYQVFDQLIKPDDVSISNEDPHPEKLNLNSNRSSQVTPPLLSESINKQERLNDFTTNENDDF
jgi:hypothetical protein